MLCRKCGNQLVPGARFCTECGTPIESLKEQQVQAVEPTTEQALAEETLTEQAWMEELLTTEQTLTEETLTEQAWMEELPTTEQAQTKEPTTEQMQAEEPVPYVQQGGNEAYYTFDMDEPYIMDQKSVRGKKLSINALTIAISATVAVVFLGIVVFLGFKGIFPFVSNNSDQMVYLKEDKLYYLKDMGKPDRAIELDRIRDMGDLIEAEFSRDGKYLYYYSKEEDNGYTLNRIKVSKLKGNRRSEKDIEEIASHVKSYYLADNNTLYYRDKKNHLFRYKNGEETDLKKDIELFYISKDNKMLYYEAGDLNDYEIGSIDLKTGTETEIDCEIETVYSMNPEGFFVYTKSQKDDAEDLYVADGNRAPVCLAEGIYNILDIDTDSKIIYYEYRTDTDKALYDYVKDTADDTNLVVQEPEIQDALREVSEEDVFNAVMDDAAKKKYLTGKKKDKKKFYKKLLFDEEFQMYFTFGIETLDAYYYDKSAKKWYIYDAEQYAATFEQYEIDANIANLRENLKKETYSFATYTICSASEEQNEKVLCENVSNPSLTIGDEVVILYQKKSGEIAKLNLDDVESVWDVSAYLDEQYDKEQDTYYLIGSGQEQKLDVKENVSISSCDGSVFTIFASDNNTLYYGMISGDKLDAFEKIDDDVVGESVTWVDHVLYYLKALDEDGFATACKYENGKSNVIRKDVHPAIYVTSDSGLIECSDDLQLYDMSGIATKIAKDAWKHLHICQRIEFFICQMMICICIRCQMIN